VSVCHLAPGPQNSQRGEMDDARQLIGSQIEHMNRGYIFDISNKATYSSLLLWYA
jgi:hypothetical protein